MTLQTKYISLDEIETYFPELHFRQAFENEESALAFLKRIEDRMEAFIETDFFIQVDRKYPHFTDNQKYHYKRALLEQVVYTIKNGDLSVDSGVNPDAGVVIGINDLHKVSIAPNAKDELLLCGLTSRKLRLTRGFNFKEWF